LALAEWIMANRPDLDERVGAPAVAHLLSAMVVGLFVQYAAGVGGYDDRDIATVLAERANEIARILGPFST
jgi:hypothetical protein